MISSDMYIPMAPSTFHNIKIMNITVPAPPVFPVSLCNLFLLPNPPLTKANPHATTDSLSVNIGSTEHRVSSKI